MDAFYAEKKITLCVGTLKIVSLSLVILGPSSESTSIGSLRMIEKKYSFYFHEDQSYKNRFAALIITFSSELIPHASSQENNWNRKI